MECWGHQTRHPGNFTGLSLQWPSHRARAQGRSVRLGEHRGGPRGPVHGSKALESRGAPLWDPRSEGRMRSFLFVNWGEFLQHRNVEGYMSLLEQHQSQQPGTQRCVCSREPGIAKGIQGNGVPAAHPSVSRHTPQNLPAAKERGWQEAAPAKTAAPGCALQASRPGEKDSGLGGAASKRRSSVQTQWRGAGGEAPRRASLTGRFLEPWRPSVGGRGAGTAEARGLREPRAAWEGPGSEGRPRQRARGAARGAT